MISQYFKSLPLVGVLNRLRRRFAQFKLCFEAKAEKRQGRFQRVVTSFFDSSAQAETDISAQ